MRNKVIILTMLLSPSLVFSSNIQKRMLKEGKSWIYSCHHFEERETNEGVIFDEEVFDVTYYYRKGAGKAGGKCREDVRKVPGRREEGTASAGFPYGRKTFCPWAQDFSPRGARSCAQGRKTFKIDFSQLGLSI